MEQYGCSYSAFWRVTPCTDVFWFDPMLIGMVVVGLPVDWIWLLAFGMSVILDASTVHEEFIISMPL